ncbi:MAG: CPBP family intramembrane metalloprotease [Acidobacteria bacterium]|nr:CPBP family intramembrane metalloprotease [Acidobacteriota bacterium]
MAGLALRIGVFALVGYMTMAITSWLLSGWAGYLVTAASASFAAAALANAVTLRVYERGRLADIGLGWSRGAWRNLWIGAAGGIGAALAVTVLPLVVGAASIVATPEQPGNLGSFLFVTVVLVLGALGEEMLFHGYAFQVMLRKFGLFGTVLPAAALFAAAHSGNLNVGHLALLNTFLWGAVLGFSFLRSGDLWLPVGLHFGWNWVLPLLGTNVSGFRMGMTGYGLKWNAGALWSGGDYGPEASVLTTVAVPLLLLYLWKAPVAVQRPYLLTPVGEASA